MVERLHTARKYMFYLMGWLEYLVSALVLIGIIIHLTDIPQYWNTMHVDGLSEYLKFQFILPNPRKSFIYRLLS